MKTSFLDYYKLILEKVSFNPQLMIKEYGKAKTTLTPHEQLQLDGWLRSNGFSMPLTAFPPRRDVQDGPRLSLDGNTQRAF
jgi:hypothetical protein